MTRDDVGYDGQKYLAGLKVASIVTEDKVSQLTGGAADVIPTSRRRRRLHATRSLKKTFASKGRSRKKELVMVKEESMKGRAGCGLA
eukprot:537709-Hanusia_phi.AAC.3